MATLNLQSTSAVRVSKQSPTSNFNGSWLNVGFGSSSSIELESLIMFDLSGLPAGATVTSATLSLYSYNEPGQNWNTATNLLAQRNTSSWTAGTVTWSTKPSTTGTATTSNSGYDKWYSFNVTSLVQSWASGSSNYGFTVKQNDSTLSRTKSFRASGSDRPKLSIVYETKKASTFTSPSSFTIGDPIQVNISRDKSSYTHTVNLTDFTSTVIDTKTGVGTSTILQITGASLTSEYIRLTNVTRATYAIIVETFDGAESIGSMTSFLTGHISPSIKPSISSLTTSETVVAIANMGLGAGNYLQNASKIKVQATATEGQGASFDKMTISSPTLSITSYAKDYTLDLIPKTGTQTLTVRVYDSRGRYAESTTQITVLAYSLPYITSATAIRCNVDNTPNLAGSYMLITTTGGSKSIVVGGLEKNPSRIKIYIKERSSATWGAAKVNTTPFTSPLSSRQTADTVKAYDIRIEVWDKIYSATALLTIPKANITLALAEYGVGVGKLHERGTLDIAGNIYVNDQCWTQALEIPEYGNLNNYKSVGYYTTYDNNRVATLSNCPTLVAGVLEVKPGYSIGSAVQYYINYLGSEMYMRTYRTSNDTWYSWNKIV